jgi:hypothetical protein
MKKRSFVFDHYFAVSSFIVLFILFMPFFIYAGTFYSCVDKEGNETLSDYPLGGKTCKPIGEFEKMTNKEMTDKEMMDYKKEKEEKDKKWADEDEKRRAADNLNDCFEKANKRRLNCGTHCYDTADCNSQAMRCDYNLQQERNQCIQMYPPKP